MDTNHIWMVWALVKESMLVLCSTNLIFLFQSLFTTNPCSYSDHCIEYVRCRELSESITKVPFCPLEIFCLWKWVCMHVRIVLLLSLFLSFTGNDLIAKLLFFTCIDCLFICLLLPISPLLLCLCLVKFFERSQLLRLYLTAFHFPTSFGQLRLLQPLTPHHPHKDQI